MQYALKTLAAAAVLSLGNIAQATPVTINVGGYIPTGGTLNGGHGSLSFSDSLITALNVGKVGVTAVEPATVSEVITNDPTFGPTRTGSTATAPISSVTMDDTTGTVLVVATVGGALQTASPQAGVSLGGTLAVTNINVDLSNKRVYASITGNFTGVGTAAGYALPGNTNVTTIDNFYLWDYATITGATAINGSGIYQNAISGLTITQSGFQHFVSALRLYQLGTSTLAAVTDYGSISSVITNAGLDDGPTTPLPEPSTYAMSALGLAMIAAVTRKKHRICL